MLPNKYPISDYYRDHVIDGITMSRGGGWWSAVLLLEDPRTRTTFLNLYRWEKEGEDWKTRKTFTIRSRAALDKLTEAFQEFRERLPVE